MSEKRKQALVAYLAALFGVAFIVVLISLIIQINQSGTANATSAEKVLALQTQVQQLQEENQELSDQAKQLQDTVLEIQEGTEFLESAAHEATANIEKLEQELQASSMLIRAQTALINNDSTALYESMVKLETLFPYLNSQDQQSYKMILDHINNQTQE